MINTKIFLASSTELKEEREQFEIFINRKNKQWVHKGIFLKMLNWEDFMDNVSNTRLQDEYNKAIINSDIFVVLFNQIAGKYSLEEFEIAFKQFKATKKPKIFVYFKESPDSHADKASGKLSGLSDFQKRLDDLGHFYTRFKNIEDLKLHFNGQLDKLVETGYIKKDQWRFFKYLIPGFVVLCILSVLIGYFFSLKPFSMTVTVKEINSIPNLPFKEGTITLHYADKTESKKISDEAIFKQIPAKFKNETAEIFLKSEGYVPIDTFILLTENFVLPIHRDNSLGKIYGIIKDEYNKPLDRVNVRILDMDTCTDRTGRFSLSIPFEKQAVEQRITFYKEGYEQRVITSPVIKDNEMGVILKK